MPIDASIPLGVQPMRLVNPLDIMQGVQQMRGQRLENQVRQQVLDSAQRKEADDQTYQQAILSSAGMTPDQLLEHIRTAAPGSYLAVQKAVVEAQEKAATAKKATEDAAAAHAQAARHQQDYIGHAAYQIDQSDYNPIVVNAALNDAVAQFPEWKAQADQIRQIAATQGKDALKAALHPLVSADLRKTGADADNAAAELPGKQAASAMQQQVEAGMVGGMTPDQQAIDARARAGQAQLAAFQRAEIANQNRIQAREDKKFDLTYGQGKDDNGRPVVSPQAKAIAEYRQPGYTGRAATTGIGKAVMDQVYAANPSYDMSQYPARQKMRVAFTSGPQSQTLNSLNTAIEHLDQFADAAKALGNGKFQPTNALVNWAKTIGGDSAPTNFEGIKTIMAGELASAFKKSGATDAEIADVKASITGKQSAQQLTDYVTSIAIPALGSKAKTYQDQWAQTMGEKDPFSVYTPSAKAVLDKHKGSQQGGVIYAKDPQGTVHEAAAGTALPAGWVLVTKPGGRP